MITRKSVLYMICFSLSGIATTAIADNNSTPSPSLSVGLGVMNAPRYSGSDEHHWMTTPFVQARDGAFFFDSQQGVGYDWQSDTGFYLTHTLGYNSGRTDHHSGNHEGADKLKGMGKIRITANTSLTAGWVITPWLSLEGKATLPLTHSYGANYQTSAILTPLQADSDTLTLQTGALFGDNRYMNTFYGVNDQQSEHSGYATYQAPGGFYGIDSNLSWLHQFNPHWASLLSTDYRWLDQHASNSPIVAKRHQVTTAAAVLYTF